MIFKEGSPYNKQVIFPGLYQDVAGVVVHCYILLRVDGEVPISEFEDHRGELFERIVFTTAFKNSFVRSAIQSFRKRLGKSGVRSLRQSNLRVVKVYHC